MTLLAHASGNYVPMTSEAIAHIKASLADAVSAAARKAKQAAARVLDNDAITGFTFEEFEELEIAEDAPGPLDPSRKPLEKPAYLFQDIDWAARQAAATAELASREFDNGPITGFTTDEIDRAEQALGPTLKARLAAELTRSLPIIPDVLNIAAGYLDNDIVAQDFRADNLMKLQTLWAEHSHFTTIGKFLGCLTCIFSIMALVLTPFLFIPAVVCLVYTISYIHSDNGKRTRFNGLESHINEYPQLKLMFKWVPTKNNSSYLEIGFSWYNDDPHPNTTVPFEDITEPYLLGSSQWQ